MKTQDDAKPGNCAGYQEILNNGNLLENHYEDMLEMVLLALVIQQQIQEQKI